MSFRFIRRKKILPGINLNLSKSGGSLSFGPRGAKLTVGTSGVRKTVGVPGTGLYYTDRKSSGSRKKRRKGSAPPPVQPKSRLDLGFFKRLFTPQEEEDFVDGLKSFVAGKEDKALEYFKNSMHIADAAFMAGFIFLKKGRFREAVSSLERADRKHSDLCRYFSKYGISLKMTMPITEEIAAHITPGRRGLLLGLVEALQELGEHGRAVAVLENLLDMDSSDPAVRLSLAELLLEGYPDDPKVCRRIVELTAELKNESSIHAALMLYKGKALRALGLYTAARDTLTAAYRRKKDRSEEVRRAVRYERAMVYRELGKSSRARSELEGIFAEDPGYEDVASLLGLE
ncbi:MAG: DUF4236 domain-containing protein [Candidatus Latescibacteria bacterium]|nr:DUF4236 domain-containing protein [bacterium]MBD3424205.1 DUF4236 domain-containing protein [Candidatus Latescibacterota bacterium]